MSVALLHAMHSLSYQGPWQIAPCTTYTRSMLTHSLAHCSFSWPIQLDQAVLAAYTCLSSPIASTKLKLSQLFERGGIYGIDDALQNRSCPMN